MECESLDCGKPQPHPPHRWWHMDDEKHCSGTGGLVGREDKWTAAKRSMLILTWAMFMVMAFISFVLYLFF